MGHCRNKGHGMLTENFLKGRRRHLLSDAEIQALEDSFVEVRDYPARTLVIRTGQLVNHSMLLLDGMMCRYMDDRLGYRQLVALQVAGDFVDLHGFPLQRLDHDVATITPSRLALVPHTAVERLVHDFPTLGRQLWFSTLLDAAMHREWIFLLGRLGVEGRIAHLFAELAERLRFVGLSDGRDFMLPLLQADIAEACGCTTIHVNRVLRTLRDRGIVTFRKGRLTIHDLAALHRISEFDARYLYGDGGSFAHAADGNGSAGVQPARHQG